MSVNACVIDLLECRVESRNIFDCLNLRYAEDHSGSQEAVPCLTNMEVDVTNATKPQKGGKQM